VEAPKNNKERKTMKKITISSKNITLKQWSNLVLELNLIKKQWKNYATIDLSGKGVKSIISKGNMTIKSSKEEHVPH
jgi:hypothetical protein|tara:strand:- start:43 stop:273 length:231 start_codon:yes stop_codon:yes gene_type:complete